MDRQTDGQTDRQIDRYTDRQIDRYTHMYVRMYVCMYVLEGSRRYPSTMAFCQRCSLVAFAEVLDQFSGIGCYSGTAVGMHLQKFWISFAESSVMMTSERHFGRPDGVKFALERRSQQPCGAKLALERRFGPPLAEILR